MVVVEGLMPIDNTAVNNAVGLCLRQFLAVRDQVHRQHNVLAGVDLTQSPYGFSAAQAADIQSAIGNLDAALQATDLTFVNRLVGLY